MRIICRTRFDITATGVRNSFYKNRADAADTGTWTRNRNQQRNWETVNQIISLRTLPTNITPPKRVTQNGENLWVFEFDIEQPATVGTDEDPVCILKADCRDVPMLTGLDEDPGIDGVLIVNINIEFVVDSDK
jgi:hypothetical protein